MSGADSDPATLAGQLERKKLEGRILRRVSSEINSTLELDEIYRISLATMDELFDYHHSLILLLEDDGETLSVVASRGYEEQALGGATRVGVGVIGMVAKKRRPLHMDGLGSHRAYASAQRQRMVEAGRGAELGAPIPVPGLPDVQTQIAIPLLVKDTLIGVFSIESSERRSFTEHDEELVTIVANQTASAIHTARLNRALQAANEDLERRVRERTAALERELRVARQLVQDAKSRIEGPLLGSSRAVCAVREAVSRHAANVDTLLVVGPPGSGKEEVARAIHDQSGRTGAFIHVNCAQLQSSGPTPPPDARPQHGRHALGARFELAHGGTIYLDGVSQLTIEHQRELRTLLDGQARARAAGHRPTPDVRTILSNSGDLVADVQSSRFDRDLHRLISENRLAVPALCERPEDIPVLVDHFVRRQAAQLGKAIERVSDASLQRLQAYGWPGNVHELRSLIERVLVVATGPEIEIEAELLEGGLSLGSYRLVRKLDVGGMGEVWLGKHQLLARPAAVKLIRADRLGASSERQIRARFEREARTTADLRSPHTVQLYDFGIGDDGTFYYVMELLDGIDLFEMVREFGPLPPERVVWLLMQACRSLAEAHEHCLIHRDIKPANLFATVLGVEYDFLKVLDFGMVKATRDDDSMQLTADDIVEGTPAFMPPELALGEVEPDGRADLYSLGCVAYWMLTGMFVFDAKSPTAMVVQHVQAQPVPPSRRAGVELPAALERAVLRCLAKRPDDRPSSANELMQALAAVELPTAWTERRARDWWSEHASALRRIGTGPSPAPSSSAS